MTLVEDAKRLATYGPVLPLRGKRPLWADWPTRATQQPNGEPEWRQATGIGLACGARAGFWVLDLDANKGGPDALVKLEDKHGALPKTWACATGGGGVHLYFRWPAGGRVVRNSASRVGPGIDVRGEGGQVAAPPSVHPSGRAYEWVDGCAPWQTPIADAPQWLLDLAAPSAPPQAPSAPRLVHDADVLRRASAYLARVPGAISGSGGHDQTWAAALAVVRGFGLSEDDAYGLLASEYNPRCVPPWGEKELRHKVASAHRDATVPEGYLRDKPLERHAPPALPAPSATRTPGEDDGDASDDGLDEFLLDLRPERVRETPPPRRYLLRDANTGDGVYVAGTVGILAAEGGTGKSYSLTQLGIAIATGATWFGPGGWAPVEVGRVLYIAGEEDAEEALRRVHYAARAMEVVSDEALATLWRNLQIMPMAGHAIALSVLGDPRSANLPETPFTARVRERLRRAAVAGQPFKAVLLDPLSRLAGADVETDNNAATRFIQIVETFAAKALGAPAVILAHHRKKRGEGDDPNSADAIRGASALKDAVRWAAMMEAAKPLEGAADLISLRIVKRNGIPRRDPLVLCRPGDHEGVLRIATRDEIASHADLDKTTRKRESVVDDYLARVRDALSGNAFGLSRKELINHCGNRQMTLNAVREGLRRGELFEDETHGVIRIGSGGSGAVPEPSEGRGSPVPGSTPP